MATASVTNTFVNAQTADADEVNTNFAEVVAFVNDDVVHVDGSKALVAVQTGVTPTADAHLATKGYADGAGEIGGIYCNSVQAVPNTTETVIEFDTDLFVSSSYYTLDSTTNFDITVLVAGTYFILASMYMATGAVTAQIAIRSDASTIALHQAEVAGVTRIQASWTGTLAANAVIDARAYQASGGNLNINTGTPNTFLRIVRLSPGLP